MDPKSPKLPIIVGMAGGTSCGKTEIIQAIIEKLSANTKNHDGQFQVVHLHMQSFYKELDENARKLAAEGKYNFDHPDAIDFEKCANTLQNIMKGKSVEIAKHDMTTSSVVGYDTIEPADVVIIEGILLFHDEKVRDCLSAKLFVENDSEFRLNARLQRFVKEYKLETISVIKQYTNFAKPAFEEFCLPTKIHADVIIPRGANNHVAITAIAIYLQEMIRKLVVSSMSKSDSSVLTEDNENVKNHQGRSDGKTCRQVCRPH